MNKKTMKTVSKIGIGMILLALTLGWVYAATTAGTVTIATQDQYALKANIKVVEWTWTSNSSGAATNNTAICPGEIVKVETYPDDGATSPTANYDITLTDGYGNDVLLGLAVNRSSSAVQTLNFDIGANVFSTSTLVQAVDTNNYFYPWRIITSGPLSLNVTNAGSANGGKIRIYVKP